LEKEIENLARKLAFQNAIKYNGKAKPEAIVGKLINERPDLKPKIKDLIEFIKQIVLEVNALPFYEQKRIAEENWPEILMEERLEEKKALPPLPNFEKYSTIITRFSPNPDFVLHIGNARALILSHEYARIYNGKFFLRFEDTDPRLKKSALRFYDLIKEDMVWLNCKWDEEFIQSDRLEIYYDYCKKLIEIQGAYVCTCKKETFERFIEKGLACTCRGLSKEEHLERWERMLSGFYKEGEAIVRVKTDISHPNPAVRDWPAFRIIDTKKYPHPRVKEKYSVWPLYNFACGIDDHLMGITHIIRGKEHITNMVRQKYMYNHFGWDYPEAIHYGRLKILDATLSKSKMIQGIESKIYEGFDDPRLATIASLRKRGITPEALKRFIVDVGIKPVDVVLSWENIYAYNRKIIDPIANRYFFIPDPIEVLIDNVQKDFDVKINLHPDYPSRGFRHFRIKPKNGLIEVLVSKKDLEKLHPKSLVRLMELFNISIKKVSDEKAYASFHSESYEEAKRINAPIIHWLTKEDSIEAKVLMPNASVLSGKGEKWLLNENQGSIIQLVRFGFGRIDLKTESLIKIRFAHN
jgi:glutamyl-tRNA synthetase